MEEIIKKNDCTDSKISPVLASAAKTKPPDVNCSAGPSIERGSPINKNPDAYFDVKIEPQDMDDVCSSVVASSAEPAGTTKQEMDIEPTRLQPPDIMYLQRPRTRVLQRKYATVDTTSRTHKGNQLANGQQYHSGTCSRTFARNVNLQAHRLCHAGVEKRNEEKRSIDPSLTCNLCQQRFSSKSQIKEHMLKHASGRPHSCNICGKGFYRKCSLDMHMFTHKFERPHSCTICRKSFSQKEDLKAHLFTHVVERPYGCDICQTAFTTNRYLKEHAMTHTPKQTYRCCISQKPFPKKAQLKEHTATHSGERPGDIRSLGRAVSPVSAESLVTVTKMSEVVIIKKEPIDRADRSISAVIATVKTERTDGNDSLRPSVERGRPNNKPDAYVDVKIESPDVDATTTKQEMDIEPAQLQPSSMQRMPQPCKFEPGERPPRTRLLQKKSATAGTKSGKCKGDQSTSDVTDTSADSTQRGRDQQYLCDTCSETFARNVNLQEHQLCHAGVEKRNEQRRSIDPSLICNICGQCFSSKPEIKVHMLEHASRTPHNCYICRKGFYRKCSLDMHIFTHKFERPHSCNICQKSFTQKQDLKAHLCTHAGKRSYSCDICQKAFPTKIYLEEHAITLTGERPYRCDICHDTFRHKGTLKVHAMKHTGERPFSCNICQKAFRSRSNLKVHAVTHTGERP